MTYSIGPHAASEAGVGYGGIAPARRTANVANLSRPYAAIDYAGAVAFTLDATRAVPDTADVRAALTGRTVRQSVQPHGTARCIRCGGPNPDLSIGRPDGTVRLLHAACDTRAARAGRDATVTVTRDDSIIAPAESPEETAARQRAAIHAHRGVY